MPYPPQSPFSGLAGPFQLWELLRACACVEGPGRSLTDQPLSCPRNGFFSVLSCLSPSACPTRCGSASVLKRL